MDAKYLITGVLYSLFIMYDVHDSIIIYWSTLLLQDWSPSRLIMNETSVTRAGEWVKKALEHNGNPRPR